MNKRDTLVILTPGFPASEADTTCLPPMQVFVKALKKNNPKLHVIVIAFQYPFIRASYTLWGVDIIGLNGRNRGRLRRLILWRKVWMTLKKIRKQNNLIGILNFWLGECAVVGTYFSRKYYLKQYTWILGQDAKAANRYHRLIKPDSSNLIALSDFIATEYFKNYNGHIPHVIPVGLDTSLFHTNVVERDIDVMGAGSLITLKRYDLFIEIIKELVVRFPHLTAVVCGKGPEKHRLQAQIVRDGLEKNLSLLDEVSHAKVLELMQRSKVFLHTSSYEGYGAVCAEALYAGTHVVSFCKPMHTRFDHLYPVETKEQSVIRMLEILTDEEREHKPVLTHSVDDVCKQMIDLFMS
jgi:glycosyltransferase involved in cell wall biosynthesis